MKICSKCKEEKELDCFFKNSQSKDNHSSYCKECQKIDKKNHYQKNKEKYKSSVFNNTKWFLDLKMDLKCEKCGFNHPAALDFHHLDPSKKEFKISGKLNVKNKEKVLNEIKKCIVLCSNCHRIEHSTIINDYIKYASIVQLNRTLPF